MVNFTFLVSSLFGFMMICTILNDCVSSFINSIPGRENRTRCCIRGVRCYFYLGLIFSCKFNLYWMVS